MAMVLCQDTDYRLLDEPLNNPDMRHAVQMMRRVRRYGHRLGKAVVAERDTGAMTDPAALRAVDDLDTDVHEIGGHRIGVCFREERTVPP